MTYIVAVRRIGLIVGHSTVQLWAGHIQPTGDYHLAHQFLDFFFYSV